MIRPAHVRMARAGLNWTLRELQQKCGVNKDTVSRFEAGGDVLSSTLGTLERVFLDAGVVFLNDDAENGPGIRLSKRMPEAPAVKHTRRKRAVPSKPNKQKSARKRG